MSDSYKPFKLTATYNINLGSNELTKPFNLTASGGEFVAGTAISDNLSINLAKDGKITIGIALWSTNVTFSNSLIRNLYFKLLV